MIDNHDQVYSAVIARVCLVHITKADEAMNCIGDKDRRHMGVAKLPLK